MNGLDIRLIRLCPPDNLSHAIQMQRNMLRRYLYLWFIWICICIVNCKNLSHAIKMQKIILRTTTRVMKSNTLMKTTTWWWGRSWSNQGWRRWRWPDQQHPDDQDRNQLAHQPESIYLGEQQIHHHQDWKWVCFALSHPFLHPLFLMHRYGWNWWNGWNLIEDSIRVMYCHYRQHSTSTPSSILWNLFVCTTQKCHHKFTIASLSSHWHKSVD